jgi:hypothetical protein
MYKSMYTLERRLWLSFMEFEVKKICGSSMKHSPLDFIVNIIYCYMNMGLAIRIDKCIDCIVCSREYLRDLYFSTTLTHLPLCITHYDKIIKLHPCHMTIRQLEAYNLKHIKLYQNMAQVYDDKNVFRILLRTLIYQERRHINENNNQIPCKICLKDTATCYKGIIEAESANFYLCNNCYNDMFWFPDNTYIDIALITRYFISLFSKPIYDIIKNYSIKVCKTL